ncbi:MAG: hypothetical protein L6R19_27900, partial [Alphaproteobacteria bacterium]|nr:hypothetical protein [Alphaproteobacteria bacterium]
AGALYAAWQDWAERAGVDPGSRKRFSQALEARGFAPKRIRTGQRGFAGLTLRAAGGDEASSVIIQWTEPLGRDTRSESQAAPAAFRPAGSRGGAVLRPWQASIPRPPRLRVDHPSSVIAALR